MAWIESHQSLLRHKKTNRAIAMLKCNRYKFIGHMQALWWWALDNARTGDLSDLLDAEIADAAGWEKDPGQFVEVLCAVGFIDANDHERVLHDWMQYAGRWLKLSEARAESGRAGGKQKAANALANEDFASKQNDDLLYQTPSTRLAPTDPPPPTIHPSFLPSVPAALPNLRHALDLTTEEVVEVRKRIPKSDVNRRWNEWITWIEEGGVSGGKYNRMPDDKLKAFMGFLKVEITTGAAVS